MVVIVTSEKIKAGKVNEAREVIRKYLPVCDSQEGTMAYNVHQNKKDPTEFMCYESYKDQRAVDYHLSTAEHKEFMSALEPLLVGEQKVIFYEIVGSIRPKTPAILGETF